jgi:hypothetical protein
LGRNSSLDLQVSSWIATQALPRYILRGDAIKRELPYLSGLLRNLRELNPPSNWNGITSLTSEALTDPKEYMEQIQQHNPTLHDSKQRLADRSDAYVSAVKSLSRRWRFAEKYGPYVIHSVVDSYVTFAGSRLMGSWFLTRPDKIEIQVSLDAFARYEEREPESLENAIRAYHPGEPIPKAHWSTSPDAPEAVRISIETRDLPDLQRFMPSILKAISDRMGVSLRKTRRDAHLHAPRNTTWFYKHHCEGLSAGNIASQEDDPGIDDSVIWKGIGQVRQLLANPNLRLS